MTSFPPAPETPPENTAAGALAFVRLARIQLLLQNERVLFAILTLVLTAIIVRTFWFARETTGERALSALYENSHEALILTKSAYSPDLIFVAPPSSSTITHRPSASNPPSTAHPDTPADRISGTASKKRPVAISRPRSTASGTSSGQVMVEDAGAESAINRWHRLTNSEMARAAEWRRLGIVLALFHKPGALDAFAHVGDEFSPLPGSTSSAQKHRLSLRARLQQGGQEADPFGHGLVTVPATQEITVWRAIYGTEPITAAQVSSLRQTILQLRLGWFENIALAHLYQKAGRFVEARDSAQAADLSAQQVRFRGNIRIYTTLYGMLGGIILVILSFIRWTHRDENPAEVRTKTTLSTALFPFQPLLLAFIFYLVCHMTLGLTVSFLLRPFYSSLESWSGPALLRLEIILQLGLYIPTFVLPLLMLRSCVPFDPLTGNRMSLRTLLDRLGYHTHNILIEAWTGTSGYLLMTPVLIFGSLISNALFHRFHTPVNPAQFESLAAQFPLDKALVFLIAAAAAPIVEETMFRGLLYTALRARFGIAGGAMLSAAIFAGVHPTLPGGFLPIWVIGVALALVYERRGSLLPGIILHGIYNGLIMWMGFAVFSK